MERSPLFYETVWAAVYAAAYAVGKNDLEAIAEANDALAGLRDAEQIPDAGIARREELFHAIRAGSAK